MNINKTACWIALALGLPVGSSLAQDTVNPTHRPQGPRHGQQGPPSHDAQRPVPPLVAALDANGDGIVDAQEIANAAAALAKLDQNGDGVLTLDELHPGRPMGAGPRGPGGPGGRGFGPRHQGPPAGGGALQHEPAVQQ